MKIYLTTIIILLISSIGISQSTTAISNFGQNAETDPGLQSPVNPWLGAQVGYMYGGEDFTEDFLFSASIHKVLHSSEDETFGIPLMGNLSSIKTSLQKDSISTFEQKFNDLVSSDKGAQFGLYPYKYLSTNKHSVLYGILSAKLNSFELSDSTGSEMIVQGRIGIGYEHGFGKLKDSNKNRWIFSISPIFSIFNEENYEKAFNEEKSNFFTVESSLIYAITDGVGIMVEANYIDSEIKPLKIGLIYAFDKKESE